MYISTDGWTDVWTDWHSGWQAADGRTSVGRVWTDPDGFGRVPDGSDEWWTDGRTDGQVRTDGRPIHPKISEVWGLTAA